MQPISPSQFTRATLALLAGLFVVALATRTHAVAPATATALAKADSAATSATAALAAPAGKFDFPAPGTARVIDMPGLRRLVKDHGAKLLVVNFWATTCGPCVEEMPHFVEVSNEYKSKDVLFVGISADFLDEWKVVVPPFLKDKKVTYPNFVVDADANDYVNFFSEAWSGALPATFIYDRTGTQLDKSLSEISKKDLVAKIDSALKSAK